MKLSSFQCGPLENNAFLLEDDTGPEAVLIDAPPDSFKRIPIADYRHLHVIITHGHWDHIADAHKFQLLGAKIYAHRGDVTLIEHPQQMAFFLPDGITISPTRIDSFLEHGQILHLVHTDFHIKHVPGHSPGGIACFLPQYNCVFVGDTLFANGVGRTDLPGGSWPQLQASLANQLFTLPDSVIVLCGHGLQTTIGEER
jgi:hydroxyacylglutathione hydrolase